MQIELTVEQAVRALKIPFGTMLVAMGREAILVGEGWLEPFHRDRIDGCTDIKWPEDRVLFNGWRVAMLADDLVELTFDSQVSATKALLYA